LLWFRETVREKQGKINGSFGGEKGRCSLKSFHFEAKEFVSVVIFEAAFFQTDLELLVGGFNVVEIGQ
jgi:hypothetical protein